MASCTSLQAPYFEEVHSRAFITLQVRDNHLAILIGRSNLYVYDWQKSDKAIFHIVGSSLSSLSAEADSM
jgi:hypothetical protein